MTAAAPGPQGLDLVREALERLRRMGGDGLARDMSAIFVEDLPARLAAAHAGVRSGDPRAVEHAAHSMKSSCGQFGAAAMQRLCATVEQLAREGALDRIPPLLGALEGEFAVVRGWLETEAAR